MIYVVLQNPAYMRGSDTYSSILLMNNETWVKSHNPNPLYTNSHSIQRKTPSEIIMIPSSLTLPYSQWALAHMALPWLSQLGGLGFNPHIRRGSVTPLCGGLYPTLWWFTPHIPFPFPLDIEIVNFSKHLDPYKIVLYTFCYLSHRSKPHGHTIE